MTLAVGIHFPLQKFKTFACHPTSAFSSSLNSSSSFFLVISGITSSNIFISRRVNIRSSDFRMPIITTSIRGNKIDVEENDLTTHKHTKHVS